MKNEKEKMKAEKMENKKEFSVKMMARQCERARKIHEKNMGKMQKRIENSSNE